MTKKLTQKKSYDKKNDNTKVLSEQIKAFLHAGGEIQKIPSGVSGQSNLTYKRLMTISKKAPSPD